MTHAQISVSTPEAIASSPCSGLFRTALAGTGSRLTEAFHRVRAASDCVVAPELGLYGRTVQVPGEAEEGSWKMISVRDEIFIVVSDCHYAHARSEMVPPEGFVEFHYLVSGPAEVDLSETGHVHVSAPNLMICYQGADLRYQVTCAAGVWRAIGMYVSRKYFDKVLRSLGEEADGIRAKLASVTSDQIYHSQMRLSMEALHVVEHLLASPYHGARELIYVEAKCAEILCASIGMWIGSLDVSQSGEILSSRDLRLIGRARELIVADLQKTMTIPELARAVGTNASKLKRGFKFLYGVTIFEYSQRCRMHEALRLLVQERLPVGQVALAVGYQHQTSFTTSFRDFFGFSPKDARRLNGPEGTAPAREVSDEDNIPERPIG